MENACVEGGQVEELGGEPEQGLCHVVEIQEPLLFRCLSALLCLLCLFACLL